MLHPIKWILDRYISFANVNQPTNGVYIIPSTKAAIITIDFIQIIVAISSLFVWILYVVAAVYPAWPLFTRNDHYWNIHLVIYPVTMVQLGRDAATTAAQYIMQRIPLISIALLIGPFLGICIEMYMCNQLTDAEKQSVSLCQDAYTNNYIDADSKLA